MKREEFLRALSDLDESIIAEAAAARLTPKKNKRMLVFSLAACLTLILLAIPIGIMIGAASTVSIVTTATPSTAKTPQTAENPKASVLDTPGATIFENDGSFKTDDGQGSSGGLSYDLNGEQTLAWAKQVKEENEAVLGIIKNYTSVLVPDGKAYYRVTAMEITVLEDFSGTERETVTAVYASRYEWDLHHYIPASEYTIGKATNRANDTITENFGVRIDMFETALKCTKKHSESYPYAALFLLKDAKDTDLAIEENTYHLSDYADYVLDACLDYEPDFDAFGLITIGIPFIFSANLIREVFLNELSVYRSYATFKNEYEDFDNHTALAFNIPKFHNFRSYEVDSVFSETLFTKNQDAKLAVNPGYRWVVTVDGREYVITRFDIQNTEPFISLHLDIGPDFSQDQEITDKIRLNIYGSENNLLCYANLSN